ncbi:MAG: HAMP domain-containing sensor histidine kinase [Thermodesulfobacteriota bacterium]|nr:HAMP domain-containing sensor histidine kinase [Thermodesulfobacteriota bacterium]
MKEPRRWPSVIIFVAMQVAWVAIVILWVVWFVTQHYALIQRIGPWDIVIIVEGAVLLLLILVGIYVLFILYQRQLTLTRTQSHILSSITHEFKTPLATMQLYMETIKARDLSPEMTGRLVDGMIGENHRLKALVEKFLEGARLGQRDLPYAFKSVSFKKIIDDFRYKNSNMLESVDVNIDIKDDVHVKIDTDAMDMVFRNLAENAIHYSTQTPRIDIKGWRDKRRLYIEFADSGVGIPEDKRKEIFKMFKRLPEGISLWGSGTGMGLYIVRRILKEHGGSIKVGKKSYTKGGSVFIIRLPIGGYA